MDLLYNEYILNKFADIDLSNQDLSDHDWMKIYKYVEAVKKRGKTFDDIPIKYRLILADFITRE